MGPKKLTYTRRTGPNRPGRPGLGALQEGAILAATQEALLDRTRQPTQIQPPIREGLYITRETPETAGPSTGTPRRRKLILEDDDAAVDPEAEHRDRRPRSAGTDEIIHTVLGMPDSTPEAETPHTEIPPVQAVPVTDTPELPRDDIVMPQRTDEADDTEIPERTSEAETHATEIYGRGTGC